MFLTKRPVNFLILQHSLSGIWQLRRGVEITELERERFICFNLSISLTFVRLWTRDHDTLTCCCCSPMNSAPVSSLTGFRTTRSRVGYRYIVYRLVTFLKM
ncbi:hypothetical protein LINGRAHAP2_LOCUS11781 [Linum grandiflorum]